MANEIVSELILDLDKFRASLKDAEKAGVAAGNALGENVGKGFDSSADKILSVAKKLSAALVAAFAVHKIIEAAKEGDAAMQQFNAALFANGVYTENASERFKYFANELQKVSTVSNDVIVKNGALLVSLSGLSGAGLERATKAALDLSAGLQIDVNTAFQMVGRAAEGNMRAFQQYGIRIQETGTQAGNFANALKVIETRFNGMAEAQTKTFGGAMTQAKNNFEDLLKGLGQMVTHSPLVVGVIKKISEWIGNLADKLEEFADGRDLIREYALIMIKFGQSVAQYVLPPFELLYNTGKTALSAIATGLSVLVTGALTAIQGLLEIGAVFSDKFNGARDTLRAVSEEFQGITAGLATKTSESFQNAFDFSFTAGAETMLAKANTFVSSFGDSLNQLPEQFGPPAQRLTKEALALMESLRQSVGQGLTTLMSGTVQRLGATLIKGGSAFADFKNFALNALGDMSIQMGEAMIVQSAAFKALAALITNPFTAAGASLAFGLALVAIGGILKAAAGGAGASSAAAMGGGGGGVATGEGGLAPSSDFGQSQAQTQKQEPQTRVVVNVQGNVLDRRETGLELAAVINEAFGSGGVTFATS